MNPIDKFLNNITMYRLVLYGLLVLVLYSFILSLTGTLIFSFFELIILLFILVVVCYLGNLIFAKFFKVAANIESSLITALILYFLLWPSSVFSNVAIFALAGIVAMASKYLVNYKGKHIFNPAAFSAVTLAFFNTGALWWIATPVMLPLVFVLGFLIVRKIRKFSMFFTFIFTTLSFFLFQTTLKGLNPLTETLQFFTSFPVIFFATIMLTEPITIPPTKKLQTIYAVIAGLLFSWQGSFGPIILTTELVLVFANIFSFIVSPKFKLRLRLMNKQEIALNTYEFNFSKPASFTFKPGQYLEWTLPFFKGDARGNRRYFTIASSPSEPEIKLGVRFAKNSSSFKNHLKNLVSKDNVIAGQLLGDFVLPSNSAKKLVFIAGGIGVTPFRSIIKYLLDKNEKRDVIFFYANTNESEIAYKNLFDEAVRILNTKIIYIVSDTKNASWKNEVGRIDENLLRKYIHDISDRTFYISGPNSMVTSYKKLLVSLNVKRDSIVTDYFPGF